MVRHPRASELIFVNNYCPVCAAYFVTLGWSEEEASEMHHKYYKQYGLALRGLVRHHDVGKVAHFHSISFSTAH